MLFVCLKVKCHEYKNIKNVKQKHTQILSVLKIWFLFQIYNNADYDPLKTLLIY